MSDTRVGDPTRHDEPRTVTRTNLSDGQRVTARDYERALTELEAALDYVPTLCELAQLKRAVLTRLTSQANAYDLALPHVGRVLVRAGLLAKVRKAQHALAELVNA